MIARLTPLLAAIWLPAASGADIDLNRSVLVAPASLSGPAAKAVEMLAGEVETRSMIRWERAAAVPADGTAAVVVGPVDGVQKLLEGQGAVLPAAKAGTEGYRVGVARGKAGPVVYVAGNDARGVLFGVGRLLRELRLDRLNVTLPAGFAEASVPQTPLRGHQIGYRPKTNSYDGWTAAMWEQYVRDLAVFGCNAIELIPPRSDDKPDSLMFPAPQLRMMVDVARFADSYGLDVWVWYPALDKDYSDPKTVEAAVKEWGEVFQALPRVDAVFVPGGDPGHTPPKLMFPLLEKQTANLRKYHPKATMWMSPQGFDAGWMTDFYELMKAEPKWLAGVVHGPQCRVSLPDLRAALPKAYPVRDYPDITHSRTCQYPVPDWDAAFGVTEGRECVNPRPTQMATIYKYAKPHIAGYITYSEGCHDDLNKVIWSALGWNENADIRDVVLQYGRYFIGPQLGDRFAEGMFALERNWVGPVADNAGIDATLKHFQDMERDAGPREKLNWRFQQHLYRAYYDGYVRARLRHETAATDAARAKLREAKAVGAGPASEAAEAILNRADKEKPAADLRARMSELAEALFQSCRAQLTVTKYHGMSGRGNSFDAVDSPLSDAAFLRAEIAAARKAGDEAARVTRLTAAVTRDDPGPGGFYDDLGNADRQPHLVRGPGWANDPAYYDSPLPAFGRGSPPPNSPRAWWDYAEMHYDTPLRMRYTGLDRSAGYAVRVVYMGEGRKIRLETGGKEIHGYMAKALQPLEFEIPTAATAGGELTLSWNQELGGGGGGRGCQVAEVWLIKRPAK